MRGNTVAVIFQDPMTSFNPTITVGNQIAEGLRVHRDVTSDEALGLVRMPGPKERINDYPHRLSGGLRQRCMNGRPRPSGKPNPPEDECPDPGKNRRWG